MDAQRRSHDFPYADRHVVQQQWWWTTEPGPRQWWDELSERELYLREFPTGDRKWTVSTGGGSHLVWSRTGDTMFYRDRERHIMAVDVALTPTVKLSIPRVLFEDRYTMSGYTTVANFDASPDGQRLAMIRDDGAVRLALMSNYFDRLAPSR